MNIRKIKKNLKKISFIALLILITSCTNVTAQRYLSKKYSDKVDYKKADFKDLNNWDTSDQLISFDTFKKSCAKIVDKNKPEYTNWINI
ncbi:murein transglycosylase, partial [Francisella philomiragia]|nr:murein transglycosylase [Francisella philomiragia]